MTESKPVYPCEDRLLVIGDVGRAIELDYEGLEAFHQGNSWWGCSVAFRALQLAAIKLSVTRLWDRESISVISKHPGPGVRDAFEYVTHCVSKECYRVDCEQTSLGCSRLMGYEWSITSADTTIYIKLRENFVPDSFFELLDRIGTDQECANDQEGLSQHKANLCMSIWREPLDSSFTISKL